MTHIDTPRANAALQEVVLGVSGFEHEPEDLPENVLIGAVVVLFQTIDKTTGEEQIYTAYSSGSSWILCGGMISEAAK